MTEARFEVGDVVNYEGNTAEIRGMRFVCSDLGQEGWEYHLQQSADMKPEFGGGRITLYLWVPEDTLAPPEAK